jgi:hypothetical protein
VLYRVSSISNCLFFFPMILIISMFVYFLSYFIFGLPDFPFLLKGEHFVSFLRNAHTTIHLEIFEKFHGITFFLTKIESEERRIIETDDTNRIPSVEKCWVKPKLIRGRNRSGMPKK